MELCKVATVTWLLLSVLKHVLVLSDHCKLAKLKCKSQ